MNKPKQKPQRDHRFIELTDQSLAAVVGGRLDSAPINVVSDFSAGGANRR